MNGWADVSGRRLISIGSVALLHILLFWLTATVRPSFTVSPNREFQVDVFAPHIVARAAPAPLPWTFQAPEDVVVPEPDIAIVSRQGDPDAIGASLPGQVVPPRFDPRHLNTLPDLPYGLTGKVGAAAIMLRLLIDQNGDVEDAKILRSSNIRDLDEIALDFVKKNWRYLPSSMGGKPIEAWTTAFVRFATPKQW